MIQKKVPVQVNPEFKRLLTIAAKTKGMSVCDYTTNITNKDMELEKLVGDWKTKFKTSSKKNTNMKRRFDFL